MNRIVLAFFLALGVHGLLFYVGSAWVPKHSAIKPPLRRVAVSLARAPQTPSRPKAPKGKNIKEKTLPAKPKAIAPKKRPIKKVVKKIVRPRPVKPKAVVPETPKKMAPEKPKPVVPEKVILPVDVPTEKTMVPVPEKATDPQLTGENPVLENTEPASLPAGRIEPELSATTAAPDEHPVQEARPLYRENPSPKYPLSARRRGLAGKVVLDVLVDRTGRVGNVTVAESSGHGILDRAALSAVKDWLFEPGSRGGIAVDTQVLVPIQFRLN